MSTTTTGGTGLLGEVLKTPRYDGIFDSTVKIETETVCGEPFYSAFVFGNSQELKSNHWMTVGSGPRSKIQAIQSAAKLLRGYAGSLDLLAAELTTKQMEAGDE